MIESTKTPGEPLLKTARETLIETDVAAGFDRANAYAEILEFASGKDVLDVVCGDGSGSIMLAGKARSVVAIDRSGVLIDDVAQPAWPHNLRFEEKITVPDSSIDLVVCFEKVPHFSDVETFLSNVRRVLRPNGMILFGSLRKSTWVSRNDELQSSHFPDHSDSQDSLTEKALLKHVQRLEKRISRMECSVWWRLRRPFRFISDLVQGREATGFFTPPNSRASPSQKADSEGTSLLWSDRSDLREEPEANANISVIILAHNNFEELQFCLASVLRFTTARHKIVVVDDCSTDVRVWPMLQKLAAQYSQIILHRNETCHGYTASLNLALKISGQTDVAIVQSNVRVSKKWLHKLAQAAAKTSRIATVSPLSNLPGPFEILFQKHPGTLPTSLSVTDIAETVERLSSRQHPEVPSAHEACLFIRREALNVIGDFDEKNFPTELEAGRDFAARASAQGFVHLIEDSTFIFQTPQISVSGFQERNSSVALKSREQFRTRYPAIDGQTLKWLRNDPLKSLRKEVLGTMVGRSKRLHKLYSKESRRRPSQTVLYIVQEGSGGTVLTSEDLIKRVSESTTCYLLRTSFQRWSFFLCEKGEFHLLRRFSFSSPWSIDSTLDEERCDALGRLLEDFHFGLVHIRHLLGSGPEIISRIKSHNIPIIFSFHDFYTICPNIQLLDNFQTFCGGDCSHLPEGERSLAEDNRKIAEKSLYGAAKTKCPDCRVSAIWPLVTLTQPLKHKYVYQWRTRTSQALSLCDGFVTTSNFSRKILLHHFDFLSKKHFRIIEHGRDFSDFNRIDCRPSNEKVRIIYFGSLQISKGAELLAEIMRLDRAGENRFEFHILGSIGRGGTDPRSLGAIYHGRYTRDQLSRVVGEIKPSFAIVPSIWPETFCHTLTEAWALGLPIFASDIGTLSERVSATGGGWLLDPQSPQKWYEKMIRVSRDSLDYESKLAAVRQYPLKTIGQMADEYIGLYRELAPEPAEAPLRRE